MTYLHPPTCRFTGCGEPAEVDPGLVEGDRPLCPEHLLEVRRLEAHP